MRASLLALSASLMIAGCSSGDSAPADDSAPSAAATATAGSTAATATASSQTSDTAQAEPTSAYAYTQDNDVYNFTYTVPAVPSALTAILKREAQNAETQLKADTAEARKESQANGYPYRKYQLQHVWQKVADLPGFLSLSAEIYAFSGGAHGNTGFDTLVWDKAAAKERKPIDFFTSAAALDAAVRPAFCKLLNAERKKRRGGDLGDPADMFNECISPVEQTLILGSSNGKTFDRLGFLVGPYAAGPYAEGSYDITLPVTKAVLDQVKPAYANSFSLMR